MPSAEVVSRQLTRVEIEHESLRFAVHITRFRREVRAFLDICPHFRVPLAVAGQAPMVDLRRSHIICGRHGARFRMQDGLCVSGPCSGDTLTSIEAVECLGQLQLFVSRDVLDELRARRSPACATLGSDAPSLPGPADSRCE